MKPKVGQVWRDPSDGEVIKITDIDSDDLYYFDRVQESRYNDCGADMPIDYSALVANFEYFPAYNTPLYKAINNGN